MFTRGTIYLFTFLTLTQKKNSLILCVVSLLKNQVQYTSSPDIFLEAMGFVIAAVVLLYLES